MPGDKLYATGSLARNSACLRFLDAREGCMLLAEPLVRWTCSGEIGCCFVTSVHLTFLSGRFPGREGSHRNLLMLITEPEGWKAHRFLILDCSLAVPVIALEGKSVLLDGMRETQMFVTSPAKGIRIRSHEGI